MRTEEIKTSQEIIEQITVDKLDSIINESNFKIIDVRSPKGIETQGNIPTAINIPLDEIDNALENKEYSSIFNSNDPILFCCTGGVMSYMAAIKAQKKGIQQVFNLEGGHSAWINLKCSQEVF